MMYGWQQAPPPHMHNGWYSNTATPPPQSTNHATYNGHMSARHSVPFGGPHDNPHNFQATKYLRQHLRSVQQQQHATNNVQNGSTDGGQLLNNRPSPPPYGVQGARMSNSEEWNSTDVRMLSGGSSVSAINGQQAVTEVTTGQGMPATAAINGAVCQPEEDALDYWTRVALEMGVHLLAELPELKLSGNELDVIGGT